MHFMERDEGEYRIYAGAIETLRGEGRDGDWCAVATAHPAKFESIVEPLIRRTVDVPPALAELLQRPAWAEPLAADYAAFAGELQRM